MLSLKSFRVSATSVGTPQCNTRLTVKLPQAPTHLTHSILARSRLVVSFSMYYRYSSNTSSSLSTYKYDSHTTTLQGGEDAVDSFSRSSMSCTEAVSCDVMVMY